VMDLTVMRKKTQVFRGFEIPTRMLNMESSTCIHIIVRYYDMIMRYESYYVGSLVTACGSRNLQRSKFSSNHTKVQRQQCSGCVSHQDSTRKRDNCETEITSTTTTTSIKTEKAKTNENTQQQATNCKDDKVTIERKQQSQKNGIGLHRNRL
jgi:glucan-binding YG repeat protein